MEILLLPDKFKGSLSAKGVITAMTKGIIMADSTAKIHSIIASDGGDGFLNAIAEYIHCEEITIATYDPLGRKHKASYLWNKKEKTAFIELAKASGIELLTPNELDVMSTTTFGTGLLLKDAIEKGATKIYLGLGGSATNDAGIGIASALGFQFFDGKRNLLRPIGKNLTKIKIIERDTAIDFSHVAVFAVNDVDNPLFGKNGAALTYAAQKGANHEQAKALDKGLRDLSELIGNKRGNDMAQVAGSGAAGGTAYGLMAFLNAKFISGIDFILDLAKVDDLLSRQKFDYIITGEGKFDNQTLRGKLIKGVTQLGQKHKVPVLALCGQLDIDNASLKTFGLLDVIEIRDRSRSVEYSIDNAAILIEVAIYAFLLGNR